MWVGCLERNDDDVVLTERGRAIAIACGEARAQLDAHVVDALGADALATMRAGLVSLIEWKEREELRR